MQFFRLLLFVALCPIIAFGQNSVITGKIIRADTKSPIARASVFLSNSSFGTSTADDGTFTLGGLKPGQYNLVVTAVGYEQHTQAVLVAAGPVKLNIELAVKTIQLKEVSISSVSKADRRIALERFKNEFIGDCKIINPDILNFSFHQNKNVLEAYTDEFLIVENHALGYRIKFLVKNYKSEILSGSKSYSGNEAFEELPGKAAQKTKWVQNRDNAYYGSEMHFYRSLYKDSLAGAGFKIYHLTRVLNPNYQPETITQQNAAYNNRFRNIITIDVQPRYSVQRLDNEQSNVADILLKTEQPGLHAITFPDYLYVIYTKRWETAYFKDIYRASDMLNYETSIISFSNPDRIALFDNNGAIIGESPVYEGTWTKARLSEALPVDYEPVNKALANP